MLVPMRFLLVEDDPMIGDTLRAALRMEGHAVDWVRDAAAAELALEVAVAVTAAPGKGPLKWFVASLPAGSDRAMTHVSDEYAGATLTVVDLGLFPRSCPNEGACIDLLAAP